MSSREILIVAGEASGDRIAALALHSLRSRGVGAFGIAGPACRAAGMEALADTSTLSAMGFGDVVARLPALGRALARLWARIEARPPRAALLVNFTELNARLGRALRRRGVGVVWCVAPQVWAWRPGRVHTLRDAVDRLAVILPFEEPLWRSAGVDARYVGHPALEWLEPKGEATPIELPRLAVLPGSRAGEISRLAEPLCQAAALLHAERQCAQGTLLLAPGLSAKAARLARESAERAGLSVVETGELEGAATLLGDYALSLCASGTATLEAALAGAAPVVCYRMGPLSHAIARRLLRSPHIALPNILLGRRVYPELIQEDLSPERIAEAAAGLLEERARREIEESRRELYSILAPPSPEPFGERVAELLAPWL